MTQPGHAVHRLSVLVCTRDRATLLDGCLTAVRASLGPDDELVVVDSASRDPDPIRAVVDRHGGRYVRADEPGLSRARNIAWAAASAPLVAFTDDDCRPSPGWADAVVAGFEDPQVDFVTGPVAADSDVRLPVSVVTARDARRFGPGTDPTACGAGANMAFRVEALEAVSGFDEMLGAGGPLRAGEDLDVFVRLLHQGRQGRYAPAATLDHVQWRSDGRAVALGWNYGLGAGAVGMKAGRSGAGWTLLGQRLGRDGVLSVVRSLRERHWTGTATNVLQFAGAVTGALRTLRRPIETGRFA